MVELSAVAVIWIFNETAVRRILGIHGGVRKPGSEGSGTKRPFVERLSENVKRLTWSDPTPLSTEFYLFNINKLPLSLSADLKNEFMKEISDESPNPILFMFEQYEVFGRRGSKGINLKTLGNRGISSS